MLVKEMTEADMSIGFEQIFLKNRSKIGLPRFKGLMKEFEAKQGIPDFVAISGAKIDRRVTEVVRGMFSFFGEKSFLVFSELRSSTGRRAESVSKKYELEREFVKKVFEFLCVEGVVHEARPGSYKLYKKYCFSGVRFWSFELKLNDWRRAVFQSLQSYAFASYSIVVFPENKKNTILKNKKVFERFGIGVLIYNNNLEEIESLIIPKEKKPSSKLHYIYALSKIQH